MSFNLIIQEEPFLSIWPEVDALGSKHFSEVNEGIDERRKYKLNAKLMLQASRSGMLKIFTARVDKKLKGYLTWSLSPDVESEGLWFASQGAWFVEENGGRKTAIELFNCSIESLKGMGISYLNCHHHFQGRGCRLGKFFTRRGAKATKTEYLLWLKDS